MRYKKAKMVSILGMIGNLLLLFMKLIVGLMSHSQAMIADAFNSAGDIFSSCMTFIGNKIASKPKDADHNLGHGKAEYIFSSYIALSMMIVGLSLFWNAFNSLFHPTLYTFTVWLYVVSIITICIKFGLYVYTKNVSKEWNNVLVMANALDHRNDCLLTLGTLFSAICGAYGISFIDALVGMGIALFLFVNGLRLFLDAYKILMDIAIDKETEEKVLAIVRRHPEVLNVTHFNSTPVGYQYQVNFTIFVDGSMSTFASHEIANTIEKEIMNLDIIQLAVIHVNPMDIKKKTK